MFRWNHLAFICLMIPTLLEAQPGTIACPESAWEKVSGMRPEYYKSSQILYSGIDSQGIVSECFEKCKSLNCSAFIIDLDGSGCFSVEPDGDDFVNEPNVTFYHLICLRVPENCKTERYWQVERSLGSILIDPMAKTLPNPMTRSDCYEACIDKGIDCKAAQFRTSRDLSIHDTVGRCSLLTISRGTKPQAYRASLYKDEYLETQCHNISNLDYCSYAEFRDSALPFSDLKLPGLDQKQCEKRCDESNDGFICRGYGLDFNDTNNSSMCFLHSVDTISIGVSSLIREDNWLYKEREPCIDVSVRCTTTNLSITLRTNEPFNGRIYASGFSETCGTIGYGDNVTILNLPLPDLTSMNTGVLSCGLTPAYSVDQDNQTRAVIWSTIIIQFNPIIQRLGDQAIKVGCSLDSNEVPEPQNISIESGFTFIDSNAGLPPIASTVMNTYPDVPTVTMEILDATMNKANVTHIGQKLILRIQISPKDGPFDIAAGHLIASTNSGDSSLLLLDELGCPVTQVFPPITKDPTDNRTLIAEFSAFKFPSSQHVKFNVIVKFCLESCKPVICADNQTSFGRKRRSSSEVDVTKGNVTELYSTSAATTSNKNSSDELPLQASIIVKDTRFNDAGISPRPLTSKNNPDTYVIVGSDLTDGQFCMNSSLALFLLLFLLIIQILLIGSCIVVVRSFRRMALKAEEDRADILTRHYYGLHGGNFEISRRVRWADRNDSSLS